MGLTFLNAGFLFAALGALLPLIIHLISRRRVEVVDFSSLRFLRELERKKIRRVRLRQILLLLIRSLIILCVALALARPTLRGALALGSRSHARTSVAIVVDDSASMSRGDGDTLFDRAKSAAGEIAGLLDEGDQAFLIRADGTSLIPMGTFSRDVLADGLDGLRTPAGGTDYPAAVASAFELLSAARNLNREIYIIGDMQRTGWSAGAPEPDEAGVTGAAARTPERAAAAPSSGTDDRFRPAAFVLPLSGQEANAGVSAVSVSRKYGGAAGLHSIDVEVTNAAPRDVELPVRLYVDDVQVGQTGVAVSAGGIADAGFTVSLSETEWHAGRAEIPNDALRADDVRHFVVAPIARLDVLIVRADGAGGRDDAYYVARALDPGGSGAVLSPSIVEASSLALQDAVRFPVVVLADVGRLDDEGSRWLERHTADGGGVLVIAGDLTDVRWWNRSALRAATGVTIVAPFERRAGVRLAPSSPGHPLLAGLVSGDRLIDDIGFSRGFDAETEGAEAILEFPGSGPALVYRATAAAGPVACLLAGVDPDWGDLPKSGLLVPLIHRLAEALGGARRGATDGLVGEDLVLRVDPSEVGIHELVRPGGTREMVDGFAAGSPGVTVTASAAGVYRLNRDGETVWAAAANLPPEESRLDRADRATITAALEPAETRFIEEGSDLREFILGARRGRELWRLLIYAAIGLLALELYVARPRA